MDYSEKRKNGRKRILQKIVDRNNKKQKLEDSKGYPIAIKNDMIEHNIYRDITLKEKKLFRYILSLIKKDDDINSTFILRHTLLRNILNEKGKELTSKVIHFMLNNISSSFHFESKSDILTIPIFKTIHTSKDKETTEVIFNEFFNGFIFTNFENGHFLKYELCDILNYKCLHSPELFELLLCKVRQNYRNEIAAINIDIEELKKYLNCDDMRNNAFISRVIKKSIEEINICNEIKLGGTVAYTYNKNKKIITFYVENINYMLKLEKGK